MSKKDGGPAFPRPFSQESEGVRDGILEYAQDGMTLRDYFAAAALTGMWALERSGSFEERAELAYKQADAMLAAREAAYVAAFESEK